MSANNSKKNDVIKESNFLQEKAITLIVLVITIIILLILAGITISSLTGENGIISKSLTAKDETKISELEERLNEIGVEVYQEDPWLEGEEYMAKYEEKIKNDDLFKNAQKVERNGLEIDVISQEGYIFYVTGDSVEFAGLTGDELPDIEIAISAGESVNKKVTLTIKVKNNINRNIKYTIFRDDVEIGQVTSRKDSFTYDMDTVFGISKVYVKSLNENDEENKSNEIDVEDLCIASLDEIKKFRDSVNNGNNYDGKTIQQIADIDMQGSSSNLWIPIGTEENQFLGVYDGKGNSISNLYIDFDGGATGFFGYSAGTIKNIGVESGLVKGKNLTAGLLGHNEQGKVENCYNKATVEGEGKNIGGVCGGSMYGEITKCYNTGDITGNIIEDFGRTCGICGGIYGTSVNLCYNTGDITTYAEVQNCRAGGITNTTLWEDKQSVVSNCYNTGTIKIVSSILEAGGPVAAGIVTQVEGEAIVENCYNIGKTIIEGADTAPRNGGIAGAVTTNTGATIKNSYWLSSASLTGAGDADTTTLEIYEKNESQMKNIASSLGSAFKKDTNNINNGYPILSWQ